MHVNSCGFDEYIYACAWSHKSTHRTDDLEFCILSYARTDCLSPFNHIDRATCNSMSCTAKRWCRGDASLSGPRRQPPIHAASLHVPFIAAEARDDSWSGRVGPKILKSQCPRTLTIKAARPPDAWHLQPIAVEKICTPHNYNHRYMSFTITLNDHRGSRCYFEILDGCIRTVGHQP